MEKTLVEFLKWYQAEDVSRFHMPGHKGNCSFLQSIGVKDDITEIAGADCLYQATGVLGQLEGALSELYDSDCFLSAGGSTLCIQTMLTLCRSRKLFAVRSAHASFFHAAALLGIEPIFLQTTVSASTGLCEPPSATELEGLLKQVSQPAALYLTSPDYWGNTADIEAIASICHQNNTLLLVDNAHGSHRRFLPADRHPLSLGADLCSDSLHKTLPAFTGAALLHVRRGLFSKQEIKQAMALFGSTSPSYLILLSIARCCDYLKGTAKSDFAALSRKKEQFLTETNVPCLDTDCSKLTIDAFRLGYHGKELAALFRQNQMEPEWVQDRYLILLLSPFLRNRDWTRLRRFFLELPRRAPLAISGTMPPLEPVRRCSLREATFAPKRAVPISRAVGAVSGETVFSCPPGIPLVAAGEELTEKLCQALKKSGISQINVIK